MKIVITGNMGCGKSTAVEVFKRTLPHYTFFDFDKCVADLYKDSVMQMILEAEFGTHVKAEVSDIVHSDATALQRLRKYTDLYLVTAIENANKEVNVIFDIPLYYEFNHAMKLTPDYVICVASEIKDQVERVKLRSGFSAEKIQTILAKQLPQEEKVAKSDFVLHNHFPSRIQFEKYVEQFVHDNMKLWSA